MTAALPELDAPAAALRDSLAKLENLRGQAEALDGTEAKLRAAIAAAEMSAEVENLGLAAEAAAAQIRLRMAANRRQQLAAELLAARRTVAAALAAFHGAMLAAAAEAKAALTVAVGQRLRRAALAFDDPPAAAAAIAPMTTPGRELERITANLGQLGDALGDIEHQGDVAAALFQAENDLRGLMPALEGKEQL